MLLLGFSAGLPILLVFGSLSFWLREADVSRSTIGFFSLVGLFYAFKFLWSPLVDRLPLPYLSKKLGRRRSWLLTSQLVIIFAISGMAITDPLVSLTQMAMFASLVAFASATQDIALDAYRIESVEVDYQAAMSATYMAGYRLAMIVASAGVLMIAAWVDVSEKTYEQFPWMVAYLSMAVMMMVGVLTTLFITEPSVKIDEATLQREKQIEASIENNEHLPKWLVYPATWFVLAAINPFVDFVVRYRWHAVLILLLIGSYRISDIVMGIMANPFYVDMGYTKEEVATITKVFGVIMTISGAALGGVLMAHIGVLPILFLGALLSAVTNLLFAVLAGIGHDLTWLTLVISIDNLSAGIATSAFIAYLSSLTNVSYSATQYALFSSVMLVFPKFIASFSGVVVDAISYQWFFVMTTLLGIPVMLLIFLAYRYVPVQKN
ncbi:MAG: MFS transporter [Methylococcales bacterium]|jgi:MFS transporter, PAT family, beta-lactamase induction signal transducer AmpG|nr:MFS transporter [Methylococcales bacterium]